MLKLTDEKRARVVALRRSPGWEDWLDIGEQLCQIHETELLKMNRADGVRAEQILSKQDQCRGFRLMFETWQREVLEQEQRMLDEMSKEPEKKPAQAAGALPILEAADVLGILPGTELELPGIGIDEGLGQGE